MTAVAVPWSVGRLLTSDEMVTLTVPETGSDEPLPWRSVKKSVAARRRRTARM